MLSIATNLPAFTEIPNRRIMAQFGQASSLTQVYQGMDVNYPAWNPKRGSQNPDYPSMFLATISREDKGGGLIEVSLTYLGTLLQQQNYTDLAISTELLTQNFSWSGPASWRGAFQIFTLDVTYATVSVSFSYTVYQYQGGAIFESMASGFTKIIYAYSNASGAPLPGGVNYVLPILPAQFYPLLLLTRFSCQQQTPSKQTTQGSPDVVNTPGIWKCQETWQLAYSYGSLGFVEPNLVPQS